MHDPVFVRFFTSSGRRYLVTPNVRLFYLMIPSRLPMWLNVLKYAKSSPPPQPVKSAMSFPLRSICYRAMAEMKLATEQRSASPSDTCALAHAF